MKHYNLKIWFLIIITILFIVGIGLITYYPVNSRLTDSDISAVESVLQGKGISIAENAIPKKIKAMPKATMSGKFNSPKAVADIIFLGGYKQDGGSYSKNNTTVRFTPSIAVKCNPAVFAQEFKNVNAGNVVKKVRKILESYKFDIGDSIMEIYEGDKSNLNVVVTQVYNEFPVFNNSLLFGISQSGISTISGMWFVVENENNEKYIPKSPIDALLTFASDKNNSGTQIVSIIQGYRLDTDDETKKDIALVPTWRILTEKGEIHYIDA